MGNCMASTATVSGSHFFHGKTYIKASEYRTRSELFSLPHKLFRSQLYNVAMLVGKTDFLNADQRKTELNMVLTDFIHHGETEDKFVLAAIKTKIGSLAVEWEAQHHDIEACLHRLQALVAKLTTLTEDGPILDTAYELTSALNLFIAANNIHMDNEETIFMPKLWAAFTDAELNQIEGQIMQSFPADYLPRVLPVVLAQVNVYQRSVMLIGMRMGGMPVPVWEGMVGLAKKTAPQDADKLQGILDQVPFPPSASTV